MELNGRLSKNLTVGDLERQVGSENVFCKKRRRRKVCVSSRQNGKTV